jgi:hypothetical protein
MSVGYGLGMFSLGMSLILAFILIVWWWTN